jgi:hypothetical protein
MAIDSDVLLRTKPSERQQRQLAVFAATAGWVLIGTALSSILFASFPFQLLQPEFQLRLISAILSACLALLLGCLLVCAAYMLDLDDNELFKRAQLVRVASRWFAILLLLIVPLQLFAGMQALGRVQQGESEVLKQRRLVIQLLSNTQDEQEMRSYIASLPDRPQIPDRFDAPFPVIKKRALANLNEQYKIAELNLKPVRAQRLERFLGEASRNSVQAVLMSIGFGALRPQKRAPRKIPVHPGRTD